MKTQNHKYKQNQQTYSKSRVQMMMFYEKEGLPFIGLETPLYRSKQSIEDNIVG